MDLASTVDLTTDNRTPIDYLTPPPNGDFQFQSFFQPAAGAVDPTTVVRTEPHQQIATAGAVTAASVTAAIQTPPPSPFIASSPFTSNGGGGGGGFPFAQAQPPPTAPSFGGSLASSSSNQVHSLSFTAGGQPLEQFTPYTPTLAHEPAAAGAFNNQLQPPQQLQQQQQNVGTRWELGFDANDILTPPFAGATEQPGGGGPAFFQQDFGPEAASSVRHTKQYLNGGGGFDPATASNNNNRFTPLDGVLRSSSSNNVNNNNNNNVYWGTPKTAQQQPVRPSPTFAEPNAYRFNNNGNQVHLHHGHHANGHHHQYVDAFQMPFTGQFDGPLSQGTVADHVVHSSFRIKRDLGDEKLSSANRRDGVDDEDADDHGDARFGDHKPVFSFVKTDTNGNFKWSVRHGY